MATKLFTTARNAAANGIVGQADAGAGPGLIRVYTGSQPSGTDPAATGTLLLEFTLSDPAFAAASAGVASLVVSPQPAATGLAAGTAGWWRLVDSTGAGVLDGTASAAGGGGELILSTTTVSVGLAVKILSGTITMPAS